MPASVPAVSAPEAVAPEASVVVPYYADLANLGLCLDALDR